MLLESQEVGFKREPGAVEVDADLAQGQRDAVEDLRQRVADRGHGRGHRIDPQRRAHDDVAEVETGRRVPG